MVPKITRGGHSFKGAFSYYLHDKGADTRHRVAWTQTENMLTDDPEKAWKIMAFTAQVQERLKEASGQSRAGRKLEKPVFAFSLAWHPEQSPSQEHMLATARKALSTLGLDDHESIIVSHTDEPQKHVHVIVNRVHPISGMAGDVRNSKRKLSDFALQYERESGKIYCEQREANHREREAGKPTRYVDSVIADAWTTAPTGNAFVAALKAKGYVLAQGRKRLVIVDAYGKAHNPTRHLQGVRAKDIDLRLRDVDLTKLPDATAVQVKMQFRDAARKHEGAQAPSPSSAEKAEATAAAVKVKQQTDEPRDLKADFERKAQSKLEILQDKHRLQREALQTQQSYRSKSEKRQLLATHRLRERKTALRTVRDALRNAPWWKHLLGLTRKDCQQFQQQVGHFRADVAKVRERLTEIESENLTALHELTRRQEREQKDLVFGLDWQNLDVDHALSRKEIERGHLSRVFNHEPSRVPAHLIQKKPQQQDKPRER